MAYRILNAWNQWGTNDVVLLYINDKNGHTKLTKTITGSFPYFYVKKEHLRYIKTIPEVREAYIDPLSPEFAKVYLHLAKDMYMMKDNLKAVSIEPYEIDFSFAKRAMIDENIKVGSKSLRKLFFDIETDDRLFSFALGRDRIVSIAAWDEEGNKYYFTHENEKKILQDFLLCANNYHSLIGWNSSRFDIPVLKERCKVNNIWVNWKEWQKIDFLPVYKYSHQQKKPSYSLDNVGTDECGLPKIVRNEKIWWLFKNNPKKLKEYNMRDVEIMVKLEAKTHLIRLQESLATFANAFTENVSATTILDTFVLTKVHKEKLPYRYPCKGEYGKNKGSGFKGGKVFEPVGGYHRNVIVIDFKSLYDRIAQSLNLSPETLLSPEEAEQEPDCVRSPIDTYFSKKVHGILPQLMAKFSKMDAYWKKKMLEAKTPEEKYEAKMNRLPVKFTLKSFYGLMGTPYCRYYTPQIAATITGTARWLLERSAKVVREEYGYTIVGGDTDSLFIKVGDNPIEKGKELCKHLNTLYEGWMMDELNAYENKILMKFECVYDKAIFLTKKRYAVHVAWEEGYDKDELKITGLEYVRSEWPQRAKDLQLKIIEMIFAEKKIWEISEEVKRLQKITLARELPKEDLIISTSLSRTPNKYTSDLPHVRVAKKMENYWVGQKIQYIITDEGEVHINNYKPGSYNPKYYWNKKIYPPTLRILLSVYPDVNWEDLLIRWKFKVSKGQTFFGDYT